MITKTGQIINWLNGDIKDFPRQFVPLTFTVRARVSLRAVTAVT